VIARTCPRDGCDKVISSDLFACSRHWYTLPRVIRDDIWHAWRAYDRGNGTLEDLQAAHGRAFTFWGQS
jgi:hypothetical protein